MIDFKRMQSSSDAFFQQFYRLYSSAFPENERRSLQNLERELNNPNYHLFSALGHPKNFYKQFGIVQPVLCPF